MQHRRARIGRLYPIKAIEVVKEFFQHHCINPAVDVFEISCGLWSGVLIPC